MREKSSSFTYSAKDREVIDLMNSLGMARNLSKILVFLSKVGEASSHDIEESINIRQSEVSIVTKRLRNNGWVTSRSLNKPSKGRPIQIYKLRYSMRRILKDIEAAKLTDMEATKKQIAHLKRLAK
jgi:predicted transcriptional regulator